MLRTKNSGQIHDPANHFIFYNRSQMPARCIDFAPKIHPAIFPRVGKSEVVEIPIEARKQCTVSRQAINEINDDMSAELADHKDGEPWPTFQDMGSAHKDVSGPDEIQGKDNGDLNKVYVEKKDVMDDMDDVQAEDIVSLKDIQAENVDGYNSDQAQSVQPMRAYISDMVNEAFVGAIQDVKTIQTHVLKGMSQTETKSSIHAKGDVQSISQGNEYQISLLVDEVIDHALNKAEECEENDKFYRDVVSFVQGIIEDVVSALSSKASESSASDLSSEMKDVREEYDNDSPGHPEYIGVSDISRKSGECRKEDEISAVGRNFTDDIHSKTRPKKKSIGCFSAMLKAISCVKPQKENPSFEKAMSSESQGVCNNRRESVFRRIRNRLVKVFRRNNVAMSNVT